MSKHNNDDQNTSTTPPTDAEEDRTTTEPDQNTLPLRTPSPNTASQPRIKNE